MRVWIVNPYGTLPGEGWREYRSAMLGRALARAGHSVTWWLSNFDHRSKRFRSAGASHIPLSAGFEARLVPSSAYKRHISVARIRYEARFARRFVELAAALPEPDVLILAEPALFTSGPILQYLHGRRTRLVVDIIDLWPELFAIAVPKILRPLARPFFAPLYRRRRLLLRRANGIVAVARDYLDIVPDGSTPHRKVVYWGVELDDFGAASQRKSGAGGRHPFRVIYAGTLGSNYDINTILSAAQTLAKRHSRAEVLLVGAGPQESAVRAFIETRRPTNVRFLGRVDAARLAALYDECSAALSTYVSESTVSMPIKAYDYLAAGLPLINSLGRDLGRFVRDHGVGLQYRAQDPKSLADAIMRLETDTALVDSCRANALALAQTFDARRQYDAFVSLIESVAAAGQEVGTSDRPAPTAGL